MSYSPETPIEKGTDGCEWDIIRSKIFRPEVFDREVLENDIFASNIAAFRTTSISNLGRGLVEGSLNMPTNSRGFINVDLVDGVNQELFGERTFVGSNSLVKLLEHNRSCWRDSWIFAECTEEVLGSKEGFIDLVLKDALGYLSKENELANIQTIDDVIQIYSRRSGYSSVLIEYEIDSFFNSEREKSLFLSEYKIRGGVQVIFGDPASLLGFVRSNNYEKVDDYAVSIYAEIPDDFILGVIPLGEYEQGVMGL